MRGVVVWLTGLPGSGKTTLARAIHARLSARKRGSVLLDGDDVRARLHADGHHGSARDEFYAQLAAVAVGLARQDVIAIVAATAHRRAYRDAARIAAPCFVEVYVATPRSVCEARDPKGLYAQARAGAAPDLPGVGVAYEPPIAPDVIADGGNDGAAADRVVDLCSAEADVNEPAR